MEADELTTLRRVRAVGCVPDDRFRVGQARLSFRLKNRGVIPILWWDAYECYSVYVLELVYNYASKQNVPSKLRLDTTPSHVN